MSQREQYFKASEIIGLMPLMLRWPVMCYKKIAFTCLLTPDNEEVGKVRPLLTMYLAHKIFLDSGQKSVVCLACQDLNLDYEQYLQAAPYLYFSLNAVEVAERLHPDFLESAQGHDPRLVCTADNFKQMLQLTLFQISELSGENKFKEELLIALSNLPASAYWDPAQYADKDLPLPPGGMRDLPNLSPQLPGAKLDKTPKHDLLSIREFIIRRCQQGFSNPKTLAREVDELYPSLSDSLLGQLLPAEFFPAQGGLAHYSMDMYSRLPKRSLSTHRKRGQRLRGKA